MARRAASHAGWVPPEQFDEYRLVQALGRGSMGQVWLAHDTVLDRLVAVKFISELPAHGAARERFLTEARAAARVQHPNIIAIYRVGEIGARPYLITEYVRGDSLDRVARPVAWPRLYDIAIGLARGLAAAHQRGVLHRDLKPANAIVSETGAVKLLDFGLAKLVEHTAAPAEAGAGAAPKPAAGDPTAPPRAASEPGIPRRGRGEPPGVEPASAAPAEESAVIGGAADAAREPATAEPSAGDAAIGGAAQAELAAATGAAAAVDLAAPTIKLATLAPAGAETEAAATPATSTVAAMGTPAYTAPEAWRGEPATPRSDVYSLGALLYDLAAGVPPHRGDSQDVVRSAALDTDAAPLATAAPGLDPRFAAIVDRCLRRAPGERFASGDEVREALEALAAGQPAAAAPTTTAGAPSPAARRRARRRAIAAALAALAALAAVAAVVPESPGPRRDRAVSSAGAPCPDDMARVPGGAFQMGSPDDTGDADEHPRHTVTLSAYCIDRTEVTVAAYAACAAAGACSAPPASVHWSAYAPEDAARYSRFCNRGDRPDHPINCVDWDQAAAYCAWIGRRLPSEAEWEYAARGADDRVYPWGDDAPSPQRLDLCGAECTAMARRELQDDWKPMYPGDDGWETTAPVGRFAAGASGFGVLDLAGNVWEWTADWYGPYRADPQRDPRGAAAGTSRVSRGGGWATRGANKARAADRNWLDPEARDCDLGFRCARGE